MIHRRLNYYQAKFMREAKANPTHWYILPDGDTFHKLIKLRPLETKPPLRSVEV